MITDFLNNQVNLVSNQPTKKKGKWANVADEMRGTMSSDTVDYLKKSKTKALSIGKKDVISKKQKI